KLNKFYKKYLLILNKIIKFVNHMNIRKIIENLSEDSNAVKSLRTLFPNEFRIYDAEEWFQKEMLDKVVKKIDNENYPNKIFYFIEDKWFFEFIYRDGKNKWFWVRYQDCWKVLREKFRLNYTETQQLIKGMLEEHFKMRYATPQGTN